MELYWLSLFLIYFFIHGFCKSDIVPIGYRVTLPLPSEYSMGFPGKAFLMETSQMIPNFKAALSVEAGNGKFSCSLQVFLGDFQVWNSGHFSQFYPSQGCILELTEDGDLQLKGSKGRIGWRTGTSGQGVERLQLLRTGNLVLTDALNRTKWQSFDFPTDVMLWGQILNFSTLLTSFSADSTMFYSFQIQNNKIALYLNIGSLNYSYWEFRPSNSKRRNITFAQLGSAGLKLFDGNHRKIAQIPSKIREPIRFLALGAKTGNLGLYHYSPYKGKFEASFQALNTTCDLPLACGPYGICTFSNTCACIQFSNGAYRADPDCDEGFSSGFCGDQNSVEMMKLEGVSSTLKGPPLRVNVSKEECASLCMDDCKCVAALYSVTDSAGICQECFHYGLVRGVKQVEKGIESIYLVKVPKGIGGDNGKTSNLKKWVLVTVGVVDGLVILLVLGGFGYYFFVIRKRRKDLLGNDNSRVGTDS